MANASQSGPAPRSARVSKHEVFVCGHGLQAPSTHNSRRRACQKRESLRRRRELVGLRGPIWQMRNERHLTAAFDATRVHKHQLCAYGHGGQSHRAYIGRPRGVLADLRSPFFEYAMWGSPRTHPTRLRPPSTKQAPLSTVSVSKPRIFEASG